MALDIELKLNEETYKDLEVEFGSKNTYTLENSDLDTGDNTLELYAIDEFKEDAKISKNTEIFTVDIDEEASIINVLQGESIEVVAEIENEGNMTDTQTIYLDFEDEDEGEHTAIEADSVEVENLGIGESEVVTLVHDIPTDISPQMHTVRVYSENDEDVEVSYISELYSEFRVEIDENNSTDSVGTEEEVTVFADIINDGNDSGTQDIELEFDGDIVDSTQVESLDAGTSTQAELSFTVEKGQEPGNYPQTAVHSEDDHDTYNLRILSPGYFNVNIISEEPVQQILNRDFLLEVEVENTNTVEGTKSVRLKVEDSEDLDEKEVNLEADEEKTIELEGHLAETMFDAGDRVATVYTEDEEDDINIEIYEVIKEVEPENIDSLEEDVAVTVTLQKPEE